MNKLRSRHAKLLIVALFIAIFGTGALLATNSARQVLVEVSAAFTSDDPASSDGTVVTFVVEAGDSAADIAARLEQRGLIKSVLAFRTQARTRGVESRLAAGEYQLRASMRPSEILALMGSPLPESGLKVTFPEGWQAAEMADRLESSGIVGRADFLRAIVAGNYGYSFLGGRPAGLSLEGYLFPDTYFFSRTVTATTVVDTMLRDFDRRFDISLRQQAERQGLSIEQVVIIASIVEREAIAPEERSMIAEVFLNRLALKMPLQADATVQYALAQSDPENARRVGYWKWDLRESDLRIDSPFNTYRNRGLPPTAIANPGLASLKATVAPTSTGYLYFVAKPDGTHAFSRALDEHNENVARYR